MEHLDYLSVRFHYRGVMEWKEKEWNWIGGRYGMSTVKYSELSVPELKKHLADHVAISDEAMENTTLCWKMPATPTSSALVSLHDKKSVQTMAKYVTDAGVIDIYARIPAELDCADRSEEVQEHHIENAPWEYDAHREEYEQRGTDAGEQYQQAQADRPTKEQKGKGVKLDSDNEDNDDTSDDSDYDAAHADDDSNSSAEDEEVVSYREQAKELKKKVKKKMLGEEEFKRCKVPDEFLVPETVNLGANDAEDCFDSDDELSYDEDSDGEPVRSKSKHRIYDESAEVKEFELGQAFTDSRQFKQALLNYGLKNFHHLCFPKDEKKKVSAKCSWTGCPWSIYGSITSKSTWFIVSRYNNVHNCVSRRNNKLVTSTFIAKKYFREIKDNPGWRVEKMQEAILEDLCADVSESKCKRAKKLVMEKIIDQTSGEYARVFDYHLELVRSNPGSTVAVALNPDVLDRPVFERMYVCLDGCKKGFIAGCRRIVGLDGCFLKGPVKGQLLCAVGRDANNQMYPIAWACVENENYDSWYWFLSYLQKDIQINNNGEEWVIISDQQKGLIKAVNEIIPRAEHRMCARHIYANWRKLHRDKIYQKMFWACAKSSDKIQFNYNKAKLAQKTPDGVKDMMKTAPEHWSRAFFRLGSYCDSVENNLCESFNNAIMRARFYPVVSQMEIIRRKITARIAENRAKSLNWSGTICPNIFKKLQLNIRRSKNCSVLYNGDKGFEIMEGQHRRFTVSLDNWTCTCRYWELSGLPCCHAISAIYIVGKEVDDFIASCYRIDVYDQTYQHVLQPVEGKESWPIAPNPRPSPPIKINMPGRPKTERRREEGEKPKGTKMSRKGIIIRCSLCGVEGQNKRKCKGNQAAVNEQARVNKASKGKAKQQEKTARQQAPVQSAPMQSAPVQKCPVKKKQKKTTVSEQRGSQHAPSSQASQSFGGMHFPRSQTIPMSQVVTQPVPKSGRMKWYLGGKV